MKKFFLSLLVCLLAATNIMLAKTISIPTSSYCDITVTSLTRDMALTNGADVFVGENIRIQYEITNVDYYLDGDAVVEKTLADADFTADVYTVPEIAKYIPTPLLTITQIDEETFSFKWTDYQLFDTISICVQEDVIYSPNPAEQKGWKDVTGDTIYYAYGMKPSKDYAVAMEFRTVGGCSRTVYQTFFNTALPPRCGLVITMKDLYGDSWNGSELVFNEDGLTQKFTVEYEDGKEEVTANYTSKGETLEIYWKAGMWPEECSFSIKDAYGNVLVEKKTGDCAYLSDGDLLYAGVICAPKCKPSFYIKDFYNGKLTWIASGAASFDVAILRKSNPTDEELEAAAVQVPAQADVTNYEYVAQLDSSVAAVAFLRVQCENGYYSDWDKQHISYNYIPTKPETELGKQITLNHYEQGDLVAEAYVWGATSALDRVLELKEPTFVRFELNRRNVGVRQYLSPDIANDEWITLVTDTTLNLPAGQYVYEVRGSTTAYSEYESFVSRTDTNSNLLKQPFDSIALGDTKKGSTKDMLRIGSKNFAYYSQLYRLILTDTTEVHLSCSNGKDRSVVAAMYYKGMQIYSGNDDVFTLPNDTFFIQVRAENPENNFTLKVEKNTQKQLSIIDIKPDVTKEGTIAANDYQIFGMPAQVYRYTPSDDEVLFFGIDTLTGGTAVYKWAQVEIFRDSIDGYAETNTYYYYDGLSTFKAKKNVPYYFIVTAAIGTPYRFTLKRDNANYDTPKITGTIELNKKYTTNYTLADQTTYAAGNMNKTKFYKVHLEKDKFYMVTGESADDVSYMVALFHPDSATGSFYGNEYTYSSYYSGEAKYFLPIIVDSTADYVFLANVWESKTFAPCSFSFEIDELVPFSEALDNAQAINTPLIEHSTFEGKPKVVYDNSYQFFSEYDEGTGSLYNAVVYNVIVKKYKDFKVRFGGNYDAKIFVYDSNDPANPYTADMFKDNTQEEIYISSSYSAPHVYTVVCAFRGLMLDNPVYDLEILQDGEEEAELVVATPVADRRSLSCNENDTWLEVKNRLSKINLYAVDSKKNFLFSIPNVEQNWEIDLDGQMAHYEVNNSDMHPGYKLANPIEWIDVALFYDNDIPFAIDEVEDGMAPIKVLRDGQLYIITQYGTFDIMGRKVK